MILVLTKPQRIVALATAGAIGIVLWSQVDEHGLEDTPWLIGILVIGALVLLGLKHPNNQEEADYQKLKKPDPVSQGTKDITVEQTFCSARNHFERFYREQSKTPNAKLRNDIKLHQAILVRQGAFMAAFLSGEIKLNGFADTDGAGELRAIAFRGISEVAQFQEEVIRRSLHPSLHGRSAKQVSDELAANILVRAEAAVDAAKVLFFRDESFPIDPMLQLLNSLAPCAQNTPEDRDRVYGPVFKSFFKAVQGKEIAVTGVRVSEPRHPSEHELENVPTELQAAVDGLLDSMIDAAKHGEKPETMLIPHIGIKLDIIIAAYRIDMKRAISQIYDQKLGREEATTRADEIRSDVEKMIFNLRREPRHRIERLFDAMLNDRADIADIEKQVRALNKQYDVVPPLR